MSTTHRVRPDSDFTDESRTKLKPRFEVHDQVVYEGQQYEVIRLIDEDHGDELCFDVAYHYDLKWGRSELKHVWQEDLEMYQELVCLDSEETMGMAEYFEAEDYDYEAIERHLTELSTQATGFWTEVTDPSHAATCQCGWCVVKQTPASEVICDCGAAKVYGKGTNLHSHWCTAKPENGNKK